MSTYMKAWMKKASGIVVKDECKTLYEQMKIGHKHSFVIFKISDDHKFIEVDKIGKLGETYDDFSQHLIDAGEMKQGRFAVFDCHYSSGKASKLVFLMWLNDNSVSIKQKMMYSSSKKALMEKLQVNRDLQCNDYSDFSWDALVEKCQNKYD